MCGICGIHSDPPLAPDALRAAVERMTRRLAHRGPDDAGVWADGGRIGLGNRRLAIIDLSPLGHQPMADERGEIHLTYNGEIYNYRELREELRTKGHLFRTQTDTEVILQAYRAYDLDFVSHLRGMFAFALWDSPRRRLLLARDRLGIKPLYYAQQSSRLVFASEIKAIVASGLVAPEPNPLALAAFLRMGSVPGPLTSIMGVQELPPAAMLRLEDGRLTVERYWEIPPPQDGRAMASGEAAEALRAHLADAVTAHLVSDVPLGVFLSGGLDSSSVVALMRAGGHERIRTYAVTFDEGVSEGTFASSVAARFETDHTEQVVLADDLRHDFDRIVGAMDQPTVDGVNTWFVSKVTRAAGTVVALSGLGGDELFGGYPSFRLVPQLHRLRRGAGAIPGMGTAVAWMLGLSGGARGSKVREVMRGPTDVRSAYLGVRGLFPGAELSDLVASDVMAEAVRRLDTAALLPLPSGGHDPVATVGFLEMRAYMHNQLLRDTDVMSMAHSLEVRVPLLDHLVVEFVARLPAHLRMGAKPKGLLTTAIGGLLPPEVVGRGKWGFTFPLGHWLGGALRPVAEAHLEDAASSGLFKGPAVRRLWQDFLTGRAHWSRVWSVIIGSTWSRTVTRAGSLVGSRTG